MQLIQMTLNGYRRFKLGVYETLTYTPTSIEQVILGSNGAGKSSLLQEIYNIVPNGSDFITGGSKVQLVSLNGVFYRMTSVFKVKAGHYKFEVSNNGETWTELNESGLQTDQRALVKEHFRLDQGLIDLMTGKLRLSAMDPNERRQWMMRICGTDFTYIGKLHKALKEKHGDYRGTVRVLTESLSDTLKDLESISVNSQEQAQELHVLEKIVEGASQGIERIGGSASDLNFLRKSVANLATEILEKSGRLTKILSKKRGPFYFLSADEINSIRTETTMAEGDLKGQRKVIEERLREVQTAIDSIGRENLLQPSNVNNQIKEIEQRIAEYGGDRTDASPEQLQQTVKSAEIALGRLQSVLLDFPTLDDRDAFIAQHKEDVKRSEFLNRELKDIAEKLQTYRTRIEHWNHTDSVDCPNCSTRFKPGLDQNLVNKLKQHSVELAEKEAMYRQELGEVNLRTQIFEDYVARYKQYQDIRAQHPECNRFWEDIDNKGLLRKSPAQVYSLLVQFNDRIKRLVERSRLEKEYLRLLDIRAVMSEDKGHLLSTAETLEDQLYQIGLRLGDVNSQKDHATQALNALSEFEEEVSSLNRMIQRHSGLTDELTKETAKQQLQEVRKSSTVRMGILHQLQERHRSLANRMQSLTQQLDEAKEKLEVYKLLDKATSPTEGIVADIIKSFMEHFLAHLNGHLRKVWSYDLVITESPDKGQSFTCQFPMCVAGDTEPVGDFSNGSTGQVSMVDFAFKLVVFNLLGFKDYPLLADEFGKDFDDEHRERLVNYIKSLIEEKEFSQLFMISHYSSVYLSFDKAEFVVLDDRNIVKPVVYNTGLELE